MLPKNECTGSHENKNKIKARAMQYGDVEMAKKRIRQLLHSNNKKDIEERISLEGVIKGKRPKSSEEKTINRFLDFFQRKST